MTPWEHYIKHFDRDYALAHPGKLTVAPARKRENSQPYKGPSKRTQARRAAKKAGKQ